MKLQFPLSIGVFVAGFSAVGCGVSDAEIPDRSWWNDAAVSETDGGVLSDGSVADAGSDGSIYGNDASAAGAGGDSHQAGSGGSAGAAGSSAVAGSGGTAGEPEPVAGMGGQGGSIAEAGSGGGGSGGSAGGDTCPTEYSMATHIVINVSWDGSLATAKGEGKVHLWTKSKMTESGSTSTVLSRPCGSTLPPIIPSAIAKSITGTQKVLPEIPNATWEVASMPTFTGTATKSGNTVTMNPGPALVGLTMSNPTGTWPSVANIMGVDHDSDGKLGIVAIPKTTDGFQAIPVELATNPKRADKVYLAIRNIMTLTATVEGCPDSYSGTANVTKFDNHVIGCHVQGGSECNTDQRDFVDSNTTVYKIGSATFTAERVDDDASCADVRAAVP